MPYKDKAKRNEKNREYYHKNKKPDRYQKTKHNLKKWRESNRLLLNKKTREYLKSDKGKEMLKRRKLKIAEYERKRAVELTEGYIVKQLVKLGFPRKYTRENPEIISKYREYLKVKRELTKSLNFIKDGKNTKTNESKKFIP